MLRLPDFSVDNTEENVTKNYRLKRVITVSNAEVFLINSPSSRCNPSFWSVFVFCRVFLFIIISFCKIWHRRSWVTSGLSLFIYRFLYFRLICVAESRPFFPGLDEHAAAAIMENPSSHIVDGQVFMASLPPGAQSSPHALLQEKEEKYSRKVFVGGLPPDIDEGTYT